MKQQYIQITFAIIGSDVLIRNYYTHIFIFRILQTREKPDRNLEDSTLNCIPVIKKGFFRNGEKKIF